MVRRRHRKRQETVFALVICMYLFLVFYMGSLDPFEWPQLFQRTKQTELIVEDMGKVFQGSGGVEEEEAASKVCWDSACTDEVTSIDWSTLNPPTSKTQSVYVKNMGSQPLTLALTTRNRNPANAENYLTLTWDYDDQAVKPNDILRVNHRRHKFQFRHCNIDTYGHMSAEGDSEAARKESRLLRYKDVFMA